jgi:hypothetical protein
MGSRVGHPRSVRHDTTPPSPPLFPASGAPDPPPMMPVPPSSGNRQMATPPEPTSQCAPTAQLLSTTPTRHPTTQLAPPSACASQMSPSPHSGSLVHEAEGSDTHSPLAEQTFPERGHPHSTPEWQARHAPRSHTGSADGQPRSVKHDTGRPLSTLPEPASLPPFDPASDDPASEVPPSPSPVGKRQTPTPPSTMLHAAPAKQLSLPRFTRHPRTQADPPSPSWLHTRPSPHSVSPAHDPLGPVTHSPSAEHTWLESGQPHSTAEWHTRHVPKSQMGFVAGQLRSSTHAEALVSIPRPRQIAAPEKSQRRRAFMVANLRRGDDIAQR